MHSFSITHFASTALLACAVAFVGACSTSSSSGDGGAVTVSRDGAPSNACTAYGTGYVCQSASTCSAGFVNKQDLTCGSTAQYCCGPIGEGGVTDANDDVNVLVDGAVFETGGGDAAAVDAGHDSGTVDASHDAGVDSGHDATTADSATDAASHDANDAAHHEAGTEDASDAHAVSHDGSSDAKPG